VIKECVDELGASAPVEAAPQHQKTDEEHRSRNRSGPDSNRVGSSSRTRTSSASESAADEGYPGVGQLIRSTPRGRDRLQVAPAAVPDRTRRCDRAQIAEETRVGRLGICSPSSGAAISAKREMTDIGQGEPGPGYRSCAGVGEQQITAALRTISCRPATSPVLVWSAMARRHISHVLRSAVARAGCV